MVNNVLNRVGLHLITRILSVNRIEIPASRKKTILLILKGLCLIGLGIVTIAIADKQDAIPVLIGEIAGWLLLLLTAFALAVVLFRMSDHTPRVILDSAGITDNTQATSPGFIPWREIEKFEVNMIYGTPFLGIILKEPDRYYKTMHPLLRFYTRLNNMFFKSSGMISTHTLDMEFDEFSELVQSYHRKATRVP